MSAIPHALPRKSRIKGTDTTWKGIVGALFSGEAFCFTVTPVLFLILGPFSAIAAVLGVCSLIPKEGESREPETMVRPE